MDDIHDFDVDDFDAEQHESFRIQDDAQAAWAMRKLLGARIRKDNNVNVAERERLRIDSWIEQVNVKHDRDIAYFEAILSQYASVQRNEGRKTVETPYGVVKSRVGQPKIAVEDAEAFIAWAQQGHEDLLLVKVGPSLSAIKAIAEIENTDTLGMVAITPDGEIIPGVSVAPAVVSYTVEVSK